MKNAYILSATILLASLILGGFYYATEKNRQLIMVQEGAEKIQEKERLRKEEADKKLVIDQEKLQRAACSQEATQSAVDLNKEYCNRGEVYCIKGEDMYSVTIYTNFYETCLQRNGLSSEL